MKKISFLIFILTLCVGSLWSFEFVRVKGTTFTRGDSEGDDDIVPKHEVFVRSFYISKYEVTQKEWNRVMKYNNSPIKGDNYPVCNVSWWDAVTFCNKLSIKEGLKPCYDLYKGEMIKCNYEASGYRLPSEAEWELAAIGGSDKNRKNFSGSDDIEKVAWTNDSLPHPVGTKKANELGIFDMSGNVSEWCNDWYDKSYYKLAVLKNENPTGSNYGYYRVIRGGSYKELQSYASPSFRSFNRPKKRLEAKGFRVVRSFL